MHEFVKIAIREKNAIVVFSKSTCPHCHDTKTTIARFKTDHKINAKTTTIEMDQIEGGSDVQVALGEISGQWTVPNVFVNGVHIGGNVSTQVAINNGTIWNILAQPAI